MNTTKPPSTRPTAVNPPEWPPRTAAELNRLRERALQEAHALRSEAIAEFWRGSDAWFSSAVDHTQRAADRLAARLRRHRRLRGERSGHAQGVEA